jgi:hypothetical protein
MINKLFAIAILFTVIILSCKKKNSDSSGGANKITLLTQSSWQFNNAGTDADKNRTIDQDLSSFISACLKDNTIIFSSGGSGTVNEGASKCDPNDPQTIPLTWSFANNETVINISGNAIAGKGGQYKIATLTDTQLSLWKDTAISGLQTTFLVNLKH